MESMRLRRIALALAALALVGAACANEAPASGDGGAPRVPALNAAQAPLLPTDAFALPEFDFASYQELLGQLEGTPVLVNIWASWCGPCRIEGGDLARASSTYGTRVQFLGVDILDSRSSARDFMREFGWTYPSVYDPTGEIRDRLGLVGQPVTLFYDAAGVLVSTWNGPLTPEALAKHLDRLVDPAE